jgi:putative IMPACT (imprinted ancient) family translation regulator
MSYCGVATGTSNHKVFPVVIQYFDWKKNGHFQLLAIYVQQQSNETAVPLSISRELLKKLFFF